MFPAKPAGPSSPANQRYAGIYKGTVVGGMDPTGQGRVQVSVPSLGIPASWAQVCGTTSGGGLGASAVIGFLDSDPNYPIVLGFV